MKKSLWTLWPLLANPLFFAGGCSSNDPTQAYQGGADRSTTSDGAAPSDGAALDGHEMDADPGEVSYLGAGGLGVADLAKSLDFYTRVIGLSLRYSLPVPNYVNEDVLYFKESPNTTYSDVVIGNYIDTTRPHNYKNNPVKLVFHVPDAKATIDRIRAEGLAIPSEPAANGAFGGAIVGRATDPDGYTLEIVEDKAITVPFLAAAGIGVSDLVKSADFYANVFHMRVKGPQITVPNLWDEVELEYPSGKGSNVLLVHYTDGATHDYANLPVKLVNFVPDSSATAAAIASRGLTILSPPMVLNVLGTLARIALGTDPDGYTMELVTIVGMADGGLNDGAPGDGSFGEGSSGDGASSDGPPNDGGANDGGTNDAAVNDH